MRGWQDGYFAPVEGSMKPGIEFYHNKIVIYNHLNDRKNNVSPLIMIKDGEKGLEIFLGREEPGPFHGNDYYKVEDRFASSLDEIRQWLQTEFK